MISQKGKKSTPSYVHNQREESQPFSTREKRSVPTAADRIVCIRNPVFGLYFTGQSSQPPAKTELRPKDRPVLFWAFSLLGSCLYDTIP
jgi:hypothetical protein